MFDVNLINDIFWKWMIKTDHALNKEILLTEKSSQIQDYNFNMLIGYMYEFYHIHFSYVTNKELKNYITFQIHSMYIKEIKYPFLLLKLIDVLCGCDKKLAFCYDDNEQLIEKINELK